MMNHSNHPKKTSYEERQIQRLYAELSSIAAVEAALAYDESTWYPQVAAQNWRTASSQIHAQAALGRAEIKNSLPSLIGYVIGFGPLPRTTPSQVRWNLEQQRMNLQFQAQRANTALWNKLQDEKRRLHQRRAGALAQLKYWQSLLQHP